MNVIVNFLSNYFEVIITTIFILFATIILSIIFNKLKSRQLRFNIMYSIISLMYSTVIVGQAAMLTVAGYIYWTNYFTASNNAVVIPRDIRLNTHWIKDDIKIYFVHHNELRTIALNGGSQSVLFKATKEIKEYHFSPNGNFLLISTATELYLYDIKKNQGKLVEAIVLHSEEKNLKGVISSIHWAPNSNLFCYEATRWSKYASSDHIYVYDLTTATKREIKSPTKKISTLYWDQISQNLYFIKHKSFIDESKQVRNVVKVYRIALSNMKLEFVSEIPYEQKTLPLANLEARNINLYLDDEKNSFGRIGTKHSDFKERFSNWNR